MLDAIVRSIPAGVLMLDASGATLRANAEARRLLGTHEALPDWRVLESWTADPAAQPRTPIARALAPDGRSDAEEIGVLRQDGTELTVLVAAAPVRDDRGVLAGVIAILHDLTERQREQRRLHSLNIELQRRISELETLLDTVPVGIAVADDPGCLSMRSNRVLNDLLGLPVGKNPSMSVMDQHAASRYRVFRGGVELRAEELPMQIAGATGATVFEADLDILRSDGSRVSLLGNASPLFDEQGAPRGVVAAFWDSTSQKKEQQQLLDDRNHAVASNRAKDHFISVLSHELRTPLSPIIALANLWEMDGSLPSQLREDLGVILRSAELEARLIDDLLDDTRIAKGKLFLVPQVTDAHELVRAAVRVCMPECEARGHRVVLDLAASRSLLYADPGRIQQVLWNLLRNAIKFTPDGGTIRVQSNNPSPELVRIDVIDSGRGLDATMAESLFKPFHQGEGAQRFGGLGLGLSISKGLVELHGGTLAAYSEGAGLGSCFTVELNVAPSSRTMPSAPPPEQAERLSAHVLLVDDDEVTRMVTARVLELSGHRVSVARSVQEALLVASDRAFDLLVSDIGLPDGTGIELIRLLPQGQWKAIAVSGYGMNQDVARSLEAGFSEHLVKPVAPRALRDTIRRVLGLR
ncbi:MAG: response regulator [Deltaproteobacteria bacterium]|nr:response regulator [Deltaproteobacteria bacterium]